MNLINDHNHRKLTPKLSSESTLSRRRPRTFVKSLTTSELSQKYNKLLHERLEIAHYQKQHLQNLLKMETKEHELKVELLKTQIEKKKKKLMAYEIFVNIFSIVLQLFV
ncbi:hypothetical protein NQ314_015424 [Rhamnusium bicolor]|uniref:Uncharacterized protein n=1 Tax=Rhamnusium bicolor TaxID=1586634 RepID=A0AAV8WYD4_9CUCU|nr:hypothetical protein NQ314_015424 [Rhamnusium bicolor]